MSATPAPAFSSSVYGPVRSWRVGNSLGIDMIVEQSTCSFNCIYCQLGNITRVTAEQRIYVPTAKVIEDLRAVDWSAVDAVTFSGSGEPTLALNLGEAIGHIADTYAKPITVLTNSTWLWDKATRDRLRRASVVSCKLDAADDEGLRRMNRVVPEVGMAKILEGIHALRREFPGRLALQCMFMPTNIRDAARIAALAGEIAPDEIQVNTPLRPYPRAWYLGSRGNHVGDAPVPTVTLKTITAEEAEEVERLMRAAAPRAEIVSVYRKAPKG
jgi:wyosine [tRNA(Phe)-imidazoG37] synthetase (radical SAM superfamily)